MFSRNHLMHGLEALLGVGFQASFSVQSDEVKLNVRLFSAKNFLRKFGRWAKSW